MNYVLKENETMQDVLNRLVASFEWVHDVAPIAYWYEELYENGRLKDIYYSDQMREMLGYKTVEEFPDELNSLMTHIHPDDVQLMLDNAIAAGTGKIDRYNVEYRIRKANNEYIWVNATGQVIKNADGKTIGMYGAFIDISQEIALKQEQESRERSEALMKSFVNEYEVAFVIDVNTGAYRVIKEKPELSAMFPTTGVFVPSIIQYAEKVVSPFDRETVIRSANSFNSFKETLAIGQSQSIEFRSNTSGDYAYVRGTFSRINENEILAGFKDCDDEIVNKVTNELLLDEYDAVYIANLDRKRVRSVRSSRVSDAGKFHGWVDYTHALISFADTVAPKYRPDWLNFSDPAYMKKYMAKDNHREYIYELPGTDRVMRRFTVDTIDRLDGEAKTLLFSFMGIDETRADAIRLHRQLAEQSAFTSYFLEPYLSAYYIGFDDLSCQVYKRTKELAEAYPIITNYLESVTEYINQDVAPEYREEFLNLIQPGTMKRLLAEQPEFSYTFKSISGVAARTIQFQVIRGADENHAAFGFRDIDDEVKKREEQERQLRENFDIIEILASEYSSVYYIDLTTDGLTPYTMNESTESAFGQIFRSEISYSKAYRLYVDKLVLSEDRDMMLNAGSLRNIMKELSDKKTFITTYRDAEGRYCEMKFVKVGNEDDKPLAVALGFADKDEELREKQEAEIIRRRNTDIIEILASEYTSVYYIDLVTDDLDPYTMNEETESEFGKIFRSGIKYSDAYRMYVNTLVHEEDQGRMLKAGSIYNILKELHDKKTFLTTYRNAEGRYCEMKFVKVGDAENPEAVALGFADKDEELREEMQRRDIAARDAAVIAGLSDDFSCVVYVDHYTGEEIHYRFDPLLSASIPGWESITNFDKRIDTLAKTLVHPDDLKYFVYSEERKQRLFKLITEEGVFYQNFRIVINGETKYYQLKLVRDDNSENHIIAGFRNVDETIKREMEYQEKLEAANKSKTDFLFNMSHDIRTPMNAIIGFTSLAKKHVDDPNRIIDSLNKIETSGEHLLNLINEVLDMSRVEAGKLRSEMKTVNVSEAAAGLVTICKENADAGGVELVFREKDIVHHFVVVDELHVNQIVMNVLGNAIKYTLPGGTVTYTFEETESEILGYGKYIIRIEDTGVGMSKEFLDHIYDAFSREDKATTSEIQGTGLGMAIVKRLVDYIDGTINIESELGKGTKVEITLHMLLADTKDVIPVSQPEAIPVNLFGKKVLLVEDNELNREIATEILEEQGLVIEEAVNGIDAVKHIKERGTDYYDFILMDIQMPLMDGFEATKEIRKLPGADSLPIIALSANAFEEDKKKSIEAGMNDHVSKPIVISELINAIARFVK